MTTDNVNDNATQKNKVNAEGGGVRSEAESPANDIRHPSNAEVTDDSLKILGIVKNEKLRRFLTKVSMIVRESSGDSKDAIQASSGCCLIGLARIPVVMFMLLLLSIAQIPIVRRGINWLAKKLKPLIDKIPDRFYCGWMAKLMRRRRADQYQNNGLSGIGVLRQTLLFIVSMPAWALVGFLLFILFSWLLSLSGLFVLIVPFAVLELAFSILSWTIFGIAIVLFSLYYIRYAQFDFDNPSEDDGLHLICAMVGALLAALLTIVGLVLTFVYVRPIFTLLTTFASKM